MTSPVSSSPATATTVPSSSFTGHTRRSRHRLSLRDGTHSVGDTRGEAVSLLGPCRLLWVPIAAFLELFSELSAHVILHRSPLGGESAENSLDVQRVDPTGSKSSPDVLLIVGMSILQHLSQEATEPMKM
jgi:hypothetical protein